MMADKANRKDNERVTIKKYANRRLYNTATSSYVTLDHLAQMVKEGTDFAVFDAKTEEDITRSVLTHIIVEEEGKGQNLLPIDFLRHLISFYGDSLQAVVPNYLDHTMHIFACNQEEMRGAMQEALEELNPFGQLEEMGKQNMAMFENAMKMFVPFYGANGVPASKNTADTGASDVAEDKAAAHELRALKLQLAQMQVQLDRMSENK